MDALELKKSNQNKNPLNMLTGRMKITEEWVSEYEDRAIKIIQVGEQREKKYFL